MAIDSAARTGSGGRCGRLSRACRATLAWLGCAGLLAAAPPAALEGEPITPVPAVADLPPERVRLGERLFHDVRLSRRNDTACASCHRLDRGGDDDQARAPDADGRPLDFNAPTVFNAALSFRLNWRGNFRTLEEQAEAVLLDPRLMGASWAELLAELSADRDYRRAFALAYGGAPARVHVLDALATFERSLLTPDAPFDRYLRGERAAITPEQERGYALFKAYGCAACHQGGNVGGNLFQRFGIFRDPFAGRPPSEADLGRFTLTGEAEDRYVFRVPSLRNVAVTGPYFQDGREPVLEEAVATMARSQLGRSLSGEEVRLITVFLRTLTGTYRGRPLAAGADPRP